MEDSRRFENVSEILSRVGARRQTSPIRKLTPFLSLPGMISLGSGNPNSSLFPFKSLSFTISSGEVISLTPEELSTALQYSPTPGLPIFLEGLGKLQIREHIIDENDPRRQTLISSASLSAPSSISSFAWSITVTTGSQDGLAKAFETFVQEGDVVLVETPTYSGTLAVLKPLACRLVGLPTDESGLIPEALEQTLQRTCSKKPRILYTIVTGHNPSGSTLTFERKKRIYELACKYNLLIFEDDPYRYLEYGRNRAPTSNLESESFQCPKNISLFSMDRQCRVLRFDSLSKILSSGLRLGFISGPTALIARIDLASQASTLHSSGVAQMMAAKLLQTWGKEGWEKHVREVALFYARRRDVFIVLCNKHLRGLADWETPSAGMFVWFRLLHVADSQKLIQEKALEAKVLLLHGAAFLPCGGVSNYVRASFSTASESDMDVALQRFADLLRKEGGQHTSSL